MEAIYIRIGPEIWNIGTQIIRMKKNNVMNITGKVKNIFEREEIANNQL
jgi:hypothetical protein